MPRQVNKKPGKGGKQNVLNMMGYGGDSGDDSDDGMEAELAAILGEGQPKAKKKAPKKLLDWSVIDAQVASSMRDVDEDSDGEVTVDDENDFMSELNDLMVEDGHDDDEPSLSLKPGPSAIRNRSPSPQPQRSGDIVDVLKSRKEMYGKAISNAQVAGETSKVRRLQRGVKTIDGLLRSAKAGKPVSEDDIPPMVATGQAASTAPSTSPPETTQASSNSQHLSAVTSPAGISHYSKPTTQSVDISTSKSNDLLIDLGTSPKPGPEVVPTPLVKDVNVPKISLVKPAIDPSILAVLHQRKNEYKNAALIAKRDGDKETALKYFRVLKQLDSIESANEGNQIELSSLPPSLKQVKTESQPRTVITQKEATQASSSSQVQQPETSSQPAVSSKPKTVLEALEQRMAKYQSSSDEAAKEGNAGKSRRMGRIVKQYKDAIRAHKAGKSVNYDELPVPPGFPPIPGMKENMQQESLMQKATALLSEDTEESPTSSGMATSPQQLAPPAVAPGRTSPHKNAGAAQRRTPSPRPTKSASGTMSAYEQQIAFLENRQAAFKRAAIAAKKKGDRAAALEYLKKMKGFDNMIEAAKNGLKVDITKVPQPPVEHATDPGARDDGFEVIESSEISRSRVGDNSPKNYTPEEEDELYKRLLDSLKQQVKKARAYAQQMTHAGDVSGAENADRLAASSQVDYDYLLNCRRHGDAIPRFYYENKAFEVVRMNPDISSEEMELVIVQCIDLHGGKDKIFVEWETPFPHDNPLKGRTEEGRGSPSPQFADSNATFRVPFNRKLKGNQRAIKSKSIKLDVVQKGGFLRSDKSIGVCVIKLNPLEKHCEIHAVEELRDGRNVVGKVEAYVRLRTPLLVSDSQTIKERWVYVEHVKRPRNVEPASGPSRSNPQPSTGAGGSRAPAKVNIASLEVLDLELKVVNARIMDCRRKGISSKDYQREATTIEQKIIATRKFLKDGGSHAQSEYISCLNRHLQHLNNEAQAFVKQGKRDQAKLALTKKNLVKNEIEKFSTRK